MVPFSILYGNETVKETVDESFTGPFIRSLVFDEIIPTLDMESEELKEFADAVFDRFRNPFIKHQLSSIALNSISKFKVRVLPSLLEFVKRKNKLPLKMVFAFACLLRFYKGDWKGASLPLNDDTEVMAEFVEIWKSKDLETVAEKALKNSTYWGQDLTNVGGLIEAMTSALKSIDLYGIQEGFEKFSNQIK